ncbi:MAG: LLM class flavin-dependent oxidoreductase [Acidimicrobiales bacterium]
MRVGLNDAGIAPPWLMRASQGLALAGGADSFWIPDHLINIVPRSIWNSRHTGIVHLAPRSDAFLEAWSALGYMAAKTRFSRIELGVGVTDAGRRHAAVTAQAAAGLHLLSKGRAILGIGTGERESNAPYGVDWRRPVDRLEEALETIRALWESGGELVNRPSEHFYLRDAIFDVPPYRGTRPPIWVAAHGPRMLGITGRLGDAWFPAWPQSPDVYGQRLSVVRQAASDAGRDPARIVGAGWFLVFTGATSSMVDEILESVGARICALTAPADLWAAHGAHHPLGDNFTGLQDLLPQVIDEPTALEYARAVPPGLLRSLALCGTATEVADQLAEYGRAGLTYPVLTNASLYFHLRLGLTAVPAMVGLMRRLRRI